MRLQGRPRFRADAVFGFLDFFAAARAVRAVGQAALYPSNLRVIDNDEAGAYGVNAPTRRACSCSPSNSA